MRPARDLEPVTLVEGDVAWIGGFEIGREVIRIDDSEALFHQLATESLSLQGSVDAKPRQVPVRKARMGFAQLGDDRKGVRMLGRCDALGEHRDDRIAIWLCARRQPEGNSGKLAEAPDSLFGERLTAIRRDEFGEMRAVVPRVCIEPAYYRVSRERRNERVERPLLFVLGHGR